MSAPTKRLNVSEESYTNVTNLLATIAQPFQVRKGEFLQHAGVPATQVHWLASGVARAGFFNRDGVEMTLRFFRAIHVAAATGGQSGRGRRRRAARLIKKT